MADMITGRNLGTTCPESFYLLSSKPSKFMNSYQNHGKIGIIVNVLKKSPVRRITIPVWCLLPLRSWISKTTEWLLINFTIKIRM